MEASIARDARTFVADTASGVSYLQILCIWQKGADGLLDRYRQIAKSLPNGDNLETIVLTKDELMRKVRVKNEERETTTQQINEICKNISELFRDREVHLYIDECFFNGT